jgi:hypothetical protein
MRRDSPHTRTAHDRKMHGFVNDPVDSNRRMKAVISVVRPVWEESDDFTNVCEHSSPTAASAERAWERGSGLMDCDLCVGDVEC